jgi:glycine betaine/choline ABC-type transport system substrate-binding protein
MDDRASKSELPDAQENRIPIWLCVLILVGVILATSIIAVVVRHYGPYGSLRAGFSAEFLTHPGGYQSMSQHYGFRFWPEPKQLEPTGIYSALADGSVDVIDGLSADEHIPVCDFVALGDDKGFFSAQQSAPFGFETSDTLVMRRAHAEELGIATISDLARYVKRRRGGVPPLAGQF